MAVPGANFGGKRVGSNGLMHAYANIPVLFVQPRKKTILNVPGQQQECDWEVIKWWLLTSLSSVALSSSDPSTQSHS